MAQARTRNARVVFPEGNDERIVAAARRLKDEQIALPILLGVRAEIDAAAARAGVSLDGVVTADPQESTRLDAYAALYAGRPDTNPKDRGAAGAQTALFTPA